MLKTFVNAAVAFLAMTSGPLLAGGAELAQRPQMRAAPSFNAAQGQFAAPPALAARSALPACGFAAVESWGSNGFQYCDGMNISPNGAPRHR